MFVHQWFSIYGRWHLNGCIQYNPCIDDVFVFIFANFIHICKKLLTRLTVLRVYTKYKKGKNKQTAKKNKRIILNSKKNLSRHANTVSMRAQWFIESRRREMLFSLSLFWIKKKIIIIATPNSTKLSILTEGGFGQTQENL